MKRVAQFFGETNKAWLVALVVSSVLFGWGHTEQGVSGWIQEGLSGILLGVLFLATGRNLTVPIVAHGVSNTLAFVLIYLGRYPGQGL
jgi:membrane protease YdiL (CAAX protease family)